MLADTKNPGRSRRFGVLAALYLVQDIGISFFLGALTVILLERGVPVEDLALITLLGFAYLAKFLLAPLVDRFGSTRSGHYKGWLIATQAVLIVALLALVPLDPAGDLPLVLVVLTVLLLAAGLHDAAINGFAVRVVRPSERGFVNGMALAAVSLSIIIGSGGVLLLYGLAGWSAAVGALAAVFLVPLVVLLGFAEPRVRDDSAARPGFASIVTFVRRPGAAVWLLLVIPVYVGGVYLAQVVQSPMLIEAGWSVERIALVQNTIGGFVAVAAAAVGGLAIKRWGRVRSLVVFGFAQAVAVLGLLPLAGNLGWTGVDTAAVLALSATNIAASVVIYTVAMDVARPESAATDLSLQLGVLGVLHVGLSSAGLAVVGSFGSHPVIMGSAVIMALGTVAGALWLRSRYPRLAVTAARPAETSVPHDAPESLERSPQTDESVS